jgi:hypothetical protein
MADAVTNAIAKLDGRDPDAPGRPTLPWRLTQLYKRVSGYQGPFKTPARKVGGSLSDKPGEIWNTPSMPDEVTVLAEILTQVYVDKDGKEFTAFDLFVAIHQKLNEDQ